MAEETKDEAKKTEYGRTTGTVKPGSIVEVAKGIHATILSTTGKEVKIGAYRAPVIEALKEAAESGKPMKFEGSWLKGHIGINKVSDADAPKAEKAPKEKAAKVELTEEQKAEKAAAAAAKRIEANKTRFPVVVGSVAEGDTLSVGGRDVKVTGLGAEFEVTDATHARLKSEFEDAGLGEIHFEVGAKVAYAKFDELEPSPAP